jgi:AraC-like DNA-binding protein
VLLASTANADPLAIALAHRAKHGEPGRAEQRAVAAGKGWRVVDVVCTSGPRDLPFEERHSLTSISLVLSGAFSYRGEDGTSLLSSGSLLLGNAARTFQCSHQHGEGDRCLSFQFEPELFQRLAHDAGAPRPLFPQSRVPPLRVLAPFFARAAAAVEEARRPRGERPAAGGVLEEMALELAAAVIGVAGLVRRDTLSASRDRARIARLLRQLELRAVEPHSLSELAESASLSPYHFLRTFKAVTGVTPHQWLLRARLRWAAGRLIDSRRPVTEIALASGFDDLSNFIRTFRAEFGFSPRQFRARG